MFPFLRYTSGLENNDCIANIKKVALLSNYIFLTYHEMKTNLLKSSTI